jgi:hypothetical protein
VPLIAVAGVAGPYKAAYECGLDDVHGSYPVGHIDDLAAQVGNILADVVGTERVCRTVEILRQIHADVVRAWLRAPVA